jgi:hypothetical protein
LAYGADVVFSFVSFLSAGLWYTRDGAFCSGNDSVCISNEPTSSEEHHVAGKNQHRGSPLFSRVCGSLSTFPYMVLFGEFVVWVILDNSNGLSRSVSKCAVPSRRMTFASSYRSFMTFPSPRNPKFSLSGGGVCLDSSPRKVLKCCERCSGRETLPSLRFFDQNKGLSVPSLLYPQDALALLFQEKMWIGTRH